MKNGLFCPGAGGPTYNVLNEITVLGREKDKLLFTVPVRTNSEEMAGYTMSASGEYFDNECAHTFSISIPAPVVIDRDTYSSIFVVVPRKFRINNPAYKDEDGRLLYMEDVEYYQERRPVLKQKEISHVITVDIDTGQKEPLHYRLEKAGAP